MEEIGMLVILLSHIKHIDNYLDIDQINYK